VQKSKEVLKPKIEEKNLNEGKTDAEKAIIDLFNAKLSSK